MSHRRVSAGGRVVADSTARQNWGRRIDLVVAIAGPGTPPQSKAKQSTLMPPLTTDAGTIEGYAPAMGDSLVDTGAAKPPGVLPT
ncbi:hypothetical protein CSOJ01_07034 [Colletotrichum sojae]|uniref:Uncharacterized protein n=1 Tax=Colletotrichum sojae TaxID=2175907 RepID=A0A8H6MV23_9PEZI|nr:hypothetical protein CSOJ01_07034 [Colletotrichum sojae]